MFRPRLQTRTVLAFSVFSLLLALFYWVLLSSFLLFSEDLIFNRQLNQELQRQLNQELQRQLNYHARHQQFDPLLPTDMALYTDAEARKLPWYDELTAIDAEIDELEDRNLHIARATLPGDTAPFYLIYTVTDVEIDNTSFNRFNQLSLTAFIIVSITGVLVGTLMGRRTAAPILRLDQRVQRLKNSDGFGETDSFGCDEIGRLAHSFADAWDRNQQFLVREKRFTREVSHELRTPAAVIRGALEILALKPDSPAALERIRRASHQIEQLIDTFLLLGQEQNLRLSEEQIDAQALCQAVIEQHQSTALVPIQLSIKEDPQLCVLPPVFAVLLGNLVSNAARYTQQGEIEITLNRHSLTVRDTGPGFPEEMLSKLGQAYIDGSHGQGLGLSIVARICQQFDWQLDIHSVPDQGSTISIQFSATPAQS